MHRSAWVEIATSEAIRMPATVAPRNCRSTSRPCPEPRLVQHEIVSCGNEGGPWKLRSCDPTEIRPRLVDIWRDKQPEEACHGRGRGHLYLKGREVDRFGESRERCTRHAKQIDVERKSQNRTKQATQQLCGAQQLTITEVDGRGDKARNSNALWRPTLDDYRG